VTLPMSAHHTYSGIRGPFKVYRAGLKSWEVRDTSLRVEGKYADDGKYQYPVFPRVGRIHSKDGPDCYASERAAMVTADTLNMDVFQATERRRIYG